jgi:hypothetical protein
MSRYDTKVSQVLITLLEIERKLRHNIPVYLSLLSFGSVWVFFGSVSAVQGHVASFGGQGGRSSGMGVP